MEGDRCLMAAACNVGLPDKPTPSGHFHIEEKIPDKRSGSYGFSVSGGMVYALRRGAMPWELCGLPDAVLVRV